MIKSGSFVLVTEYNDTHRMIKLIIDYQMIISVCFWVFFINDKMTLEHTLYLVNFLENNSPFLQGLNKLSAREKVNDNVIYWLVWWDSDYNGISTSQRLFYA